MGRLIDADAFDKRIRLAVGSCEEELTEDFKDGISTVLEMMKTAPTVDAVPVRHGRWIYHIDDLFPAESTQECDQCHEEQPLTCDDNYCPNCGARMDGKDGESE
jgi:hypothetical protein